MTLFQKRGGAWVQLGSSRFDNIDPLGAQAFEVQLVYFSSDLSQVPLLKAIEVDSK
jgi:hypothetical protein